MTYRQTETSREIRLWIGQVIVPTAVGVATILRLHPELPAKVKWQYRITKANIKNKFSKKEEVR